MSSTVLLTSQNSLEKNAASIISGVTGALSQRAKFTRRDPPATVRGPLANIQKNFKK